MSSARNPVWKDPRVMIAVVVVAGAVAVAAIVRGVPVTLSAGSPSLTVGGADVVEAADQ